MSTLLNFLEGVARGMVCTLHVDILKGTKR
jgi:hypothetical protein